MTKAQLRTIYKAKRQGMSTDELARASEQIFLQFQEYRDVVSATHIHVFLPISQYNEVDTWPIINWLWQHRPAITIVISVSDFKTGALTHFALTPKSVLLVNRYGIPEPDPISSVSIPLSAIDIVLVPLLIFDRQGHRVGYGKGFYDRFLVQCRPDCLKVGLSVFEPVERVGDVIETDVALNLAITPTTTYFF